MVVSDLSGGPAHSTDTVMLYEEPAEESEKSREKRQEASERKRRYDI